MAQDPNIFAVLLVKTFVNQGGGVTPSYLFTFMTDFEKIRGCIKVYVNKDKQVTFKVARCNAKYEITGDLKIHKKEEHKFRNTLNYCLNKYKNENPQYLWYHYK